MRNQAELESRLYYLHTGEERISIDDVDWWSIKILYDIEWFVRDTRYQYIALKKLDHRWHIFICGLVKNNESGVSAVDAPGFQTFSKSSHESSWVFGRKVLSDSSLDSKIGFIFHSLSASSNSESTVVYNVESCITFELNQWLLIVDLSLN